MKYAFDLVGVSQFYISSTNSSKLLRVQEQNIQQHTSVPLTRFLESVETITPKPGWSLDQVVDTVVKFWVNNSDSIRYWKTRLDDAGKDNLLVARVADIKSLKAEFESLLGEK